MQEVVIRNRALPPEGHRKIPWVPQHSPVLDPISRDKLADGTRQGRKLATNIHLEAKAAYLALLLAGAGADVTVVESNPLSIQDDVSAALVERGVQVSATHDSSDEEFERHLPQALEIGPELLIDDGQG